MQTKVPTCKVMQKAPVAKSSKVPWYTAASNLQDIIKNHVRELQLIEFDKFNLISNFAEEILHAQTEQDLFNKACSWKEKFLEVFLYDLRIKYDPAIKNKSIGEIKLIAQLQKLLIVISRCLSGKRDENRRDFFGQISNSWYAIDPTIRLINKAIAALQIRIDAYDLFNRYKKCDLDVLDERLPRSIKELSARIDEVQAGDPEDCFGDIKKYCARLQASLQKSFHAVKSTAAAKETLLTKAVSEENKIVVSSQMRPENAEILLPEMPLLPEIKYEIIPEFKIFTPKVTLPNNTLSLKDLSKQFVEFLDANISDVIPDEKVRGQLQKCYDDSTGLYMYDDIKCDDVNTIAASLFVHVNNLAKFLSSYDVISWTWWNYVANPKLFNFIWEKKNILCKIFRADGEIKTINMLQFVMSIDSYLKYAINNYSKVATRYLDDVDKQLQYRIREAVVSLYVKDIKSIIAEFPHVDEDKYQGKQRELMAKAVIIAGIIVDFAIKTNALHIDGKVHNKHQFFAGDLASLLHAKMICAFNSRKCPEEYESILGQIDTSNNNPFGKFISDCTTFVREIFDVLALQKTQEMISSVSGDSLVSENGDGKKEAKSEKSDDAYQAGCKNEIAREIPLTQNWWRRFAAKITQFFIGIKNVICSLFGCGAIENDEPSIKAVNFVQNSIHEDVAKKTMIQEIANNSRTQNIDLGSKCAPLGEAESLSLEHLPPRNMTHAYFFTLALHDDNGCDQVSEKRISIA